MATAGDLLANDLRWSADQLHRNVVAHDDATVRRGIADWESNPRLFPLGNADGEMGSSPRFPMYDNDFGWGKPLAVRSGGANKFDGKISAFPGKEKLAVEERNIFAGRENVGDDDVFGGSGDKISSGVVAGRSETERRRSATVDFFSGYTMHLEIISLHHYLLLDRKGSEKGTAKTSKPLVKGFVHDNDDEVMKITKVLKNKRGGDPLFSEIHMSRYRDQAKLHELQVMFVGEPKRRTQYSTILGAYFSGFREANKLLKH
ncbi:hypothetical protein Bca101_069906 [Brassica carinata]